MVLHVPLFCIGGGPAPLHAAVRLVVAIAAVAFALALAGAPPALARTSLTTFAAKQKPADWHPAATRIGPAVGAPPIAALLKGETTVGYLFLNTDMVGATGYSGKPIHILVGIDTKGVITAVKLVKHAEPIVLIGIPEKDITDFMKRYVGRRVLDLVAATKSKTRSVDVVSGATVTVMVIDDSIVRAALKVMRIKGLGGLRATGGAAEPARKIDRTKVEVRDWIGLIGDGSVRRLKLSVGDVTAAFAATGNKTAAAAHGDANPKSTFIDLYAALVSIPTIGRSLLGQAEYALLEKRLKPGQQAILIAGRGVYSFKGSGFVRGGIFGRIQLIQGDLSTRFRDRDYKNIGDIAAEGAPKFREIALFVMPKGVTLKPAKPWRLQLLVQRAMGPIEKAFLTFDLGYRAPAEFFVPVKAKVPAAAASGPAAKPAATGEPLWMRIWRGRIVDIAILLAAMGALTLVFFSQNWLAARPKLAVRVRVAFLTFTVLWIGAYAGAQLSVVNVLTFTNRLMNEFRWEFFLVDPLIFVLWGSVAAGLLFWGRGPYCGWLCPFGALQELVNRVAKYFKVPQVRLPWGLHERLWPIKYLIFLGLLALSIYSLALAETASEIEPFKTAIVLRFAREWPFVIYALTLLGIGIFIERFFCRYLCPLGAALAIPGRLRMFEWLRRYKQCGSPCQSCANTCMVEAIHPDGHINPNECLYCLHCQILYYDDHACPVMIERRERRERRQRLASKTPQPAVGGE